MKDDITLIAPLRSPGAAFGGGVAAVVVVMLTKLAFGVRTDGQVLFG